VPRQRHHPDRWTVGQLRTGGAPERRYYWSGEDTFRSDYNTYENAEPIRLNRSSCSVWRWGKITPEFCGKGHRRHRGADRARTMPSIARWWPMRPARAVALEGSAAVADIRRAPLLPWSRIRVLLLGRDAMQPGLCTQRRQIQTGAPRRYNESIQASLRTFRTARHPVPAGIVRGPDRDTEREIARPPSFSTPKSPGTPDQHLRRGAAAQA
jgi:hypothetical protein